jgi:hypothetical protein
VLAGTGQQPQQQRRQYQHEGQRYDQTAKCDRAEFGEAKLV